jgi:uncharacterized protein YecT (DUF1311 family)/transcription elongation factor Elf1
MPLKTFKCPQCGDTLQVNGYSNTAKCESCGSEISIETKTGEDRAKANKYLQLAETAENAEQYGEAENYYKLAIEHDINNVRAWIGRGFLNYSKGANHKESEIYLKTALDHSTNKQEISKLIADKLVHEYEDYSKALEYDPHNITAIVCYGMDYIISRGEEWNGFISLLKKEISSTEENDEDLKKKIYELVKVRITIKHVNILIKNSDHNNIIFYLLSLNPEDKSLLYKIYDILDKYLIDLLDKDIIETNVILEYLNEIAIISPGEIYFAEKTNILKRIDDISNELILAYKDGQYSYEAKTILEDFLEFREKVIRALQHIKTDITYQVIKIPKRLSPSAFLLYSIIGLASISFIAVNFNNFYYSLKTARQQVSDKEISQKVENSIAVNNQQITVKPIDSNNNGCGNRMGGFDALYRGKIIGITFTHGEIESDIEICSKPGEKLSILNKQVDVIGNWNGKDGVGVGQFNAKKIFISEKKGYQAIVDEKEAVFTFPINPQRQYEWCPGGLQYAWNVEVRNNSNNYEMGFSLFTSMGASLCGKGDLRALLNAGQFDVWKITEDRGTIVPDLKIEYKLSTNEKALTIKLTDKEAIKLIFSNQPKDVVFKSQILEKKSSVKVPVEYTSASTPKQMSTISPSFVCGKASTESERLICSNNELAQADIQLAQAYKVAIGKAIDRSALKREQARWLKNQRDICPDVNSMLQVYQVRIAQLSK